MIDESMKKLLEKFNTTETWIDADILAKLKGGLKEQSDYLLTIKI